MNRAWRRRKDGFTVRADQAGSDFTHEFEDGRVLRVCRGDYIVHKDGREVLVRREYFERLYEPAVSASGGRQVMPAHTFRLHSEKMEPLLCTQFAGEGAAVQDVLAVTVMEYLNGKPYPGRMRASVTAGKRRTDYVLEVKNNILEMYRRAGRFPLSEKLDGVGRVSGGRQAPCRYAVSLHADRPDPANCSRIECRPTDVPRMLARVAADHLKGSPNSGAVRACVTIGRKYFRYLLVPEGDALCVYRCVQESTRVEVQE